MADPGKPCPICGKPVMVRHRPFCSPRCADIDLGRWFTEGYAVPVRAPAPPPDDDAG